MFSVGFSHERGSFFHGTRLRNRPYMLCVICIAVSFQNICTFIFKVCLIYQISKHRRLIFRREKLDHRVKRKLRMGVFVCVWGECVLTIFYVPQAPMKRVWNHLLPKIYITEKCESLYKRQIIFENPPDPTLGFDIGTEWI